MPPPPASRAYVAWGWAAAAALFASYPVLFGVHLLLDNRAWYVERALRRLSHAVFVALYDADGVFASSVVQASMLVTAPLGFGALVVHPLLVALALGLLALGLRRGRPGAATASFWLLALLAAGSAVAAVSPGVDLVARGANVLVGGAAAAGAWALRDAREPPPRAERA